MQNLVLLKPYTCFCLWGFFFYPYCYFIRSPVFTVLSTASKTKIGFFHHFLSLCTDLQKIFGVVFADSQNVELLLVVDIAASYPISLSFKHFFFFVLSKEVFDSATDTRAQLFQAWYTSVSSPPYAAHACTLQ